ncbi:hypothetical protein CN378_10305 [Bacillus sp. AFS015802]|uniref:flagellar hook-length control protein FliK n=1 Tax=Bacillus sp. AFS015802 TaxID=2033486 RepID=UPI000BFA5BEF|nr:flagellar hook-length control protein FliK [Bacillus sp. AFS015802]PFA67900.1 hypothetical protein CN378_10305 [Bacillus sp. AFS015802]
MTHIHGTSGNQPLSSGGGKPFSLQSGKVLYIKVHKLLGDDIAEVSASGQRFVAKLEAPLKAEGRYWVEVKQSESGVSLHLIPSQHGEADAADIASKLLHHLSISSKEKEMTSLVRDLVKNQIPIHKEMLIFAEKHVKGKEATLNAKIIVEMARRNMPFTDRIFLSIKSGEKSDFISMLDTLISKLSDTGRDAPTLHILQKLQEPMRMNLSANLVSKALTGLADPSQPFSNRLGHFDLLKSLGFFSKDALMHQWKEAVTGMLINGQTSENQRKGNGVMSPSTPAAGGLPDERNQTTANTGIVQGKNAAALVDKWLSILTTSENPINGKKEETPEYAAKQLVELAGKEKLLEMNFTRLKEMWGEGVPSSNQEKIFQKLHHQAVLALTQQLTGDELSKALKRVIGDFGINYEARINKGYEIQGQSLKEHLIGISMNHPASDIRQLADEIVLKMNHQVLHSQDHSPFLTIVQQFPLYLFGRNTDITLQWTGKEKENGVIDGDYCRVLFYLNLEGLKETLIDMQVQNRVISLTVWNEHPAVEALSRSLIPDLKEGLEKLDYQLSAIKVKEPDKQSELSGKILGEQSEPIFTGVDVKI